MKIFVWDLKEEKNRGCYQLYYWYFYAGDISIGLVINPLSANGCFSRQRRAEIPTLTLLSITSQILSIVSGKLLSYERALNSLSNNSSVFKFGPIERAIASCVGTAYMTGMLLLFLFVPVSFEYYSIINWKLQSGNRFCLWYYLVYVLELW